MASTYYAIAGEHAGTVEALHGAYTSVRPYILAQGEDASEVQARGIERAGHDDVRLWDAAARLWLGQRDGEVVEVRYHARSADGRHEATQIRNGRWVAGRAYGDCPRCTSRGVAASGHAVDASTTTYATATEALAAESAEDGEHAES